MYNIYIYVYIICIYIYMYNIYIYVYMYPMKWPLDIQSNHIFIHDSPPGVLRQGAGLPTK